MSLTIPKRKSIKTIGLVGNNKSGKRLTSQYFNSCFGIPSFNADLAFKMIINYDEKTKRKIISYFGDIAFFKNKYLNPSYFDNPIKMMRLVEIAEERVFEKFFSWKKRQKSDFVIFRCTILHGIFNPVNFNKVISVYCPKDISEWRSSLEPNKDIFHDIQVEEYPLDYLKKRSDFVIENDLSKLMLSQVEEIYKTISNNK